MNDNVSKLPYIISVYNCGEQKLPKYETKKSAGMDIRADFSRISIDNTVKVFGEGHFNFPNEAYKNRCLMLEPGARAMIPTGICLGMDSANLECQVRPRSGLALKEGITVLNTPGTIDSDYTNEIHVILINLSNKTVCIDDGERIAQLVFNKVEHIEFYPVYSKKDLGVGEHKEGFGHTGKN